MDSVISIRHRTADYLSKTFYNITTVSLYNWMTYGEMRLLAERRHSLDTVEDNLPIQTLEQGMDLLQIMRNIEGFTREFSYDVNSQAGP
jgi:WASH complex subunit 7